jgi:hypothetical protein
LLSKWRRTCGSGFTREKASTEISWQRNSAAHQFDGLLLARRQDLGLTSTTSSSFWLYTLVAMRTLNLGSFSRISRHGQGVANFHRLLEAHLLAQVDGARARQVQATAALISAPLNMPWAMRSRNMLLAANSASRCTGLWSPDIAANSWMSRSSTDFL